MVSPTSTPIAQGIAIDGDRTWFDGTSVVRVPVPVNRFPDFVAHTVHRLKALCPSMGKRRIADMLGRAGLHLSQSSVARMLKRKPANPPTTSPSQKPAAGRTVTARYPGHSWNLDLTLMPTRAGFWAPWLPSMLVQRWPFCWWIAVIQDHFSRGVVGFAAFHKEPTSDEMCLILDRAVQRKGCAPKYAISDHGVQFGQLIEYCVPEMTAYASRRKGCRPCLIASRMAKEAVNLPVWVTRSGRERVSRLLRRYHC